MKTSSCRQACVLSTVSCQLGDKCCMAGTTTPGEACPAAMFPETDSVCP